MAKNTKNCKAPLPSSQKRNISFKLTASKTCCVITHVLVHLKKSSQEVCKYWDTPQVPFGFHIKSPVIMENQENIIDTWPIPKHTFGVEMEFDFAVLKTLHKAFEASGDGFIPGDADYRPPHTKSATELEAEAEDAGPSDIGYLVDGDVVMTDAAEGSRPSTGKQSNNSSPDTRYSMSFESLSSILRYLRALLTLKLPHSPAGPALLGDVVWLEKIGSKDIEVGKWNLVIDGSVVPQRKNFLMYLKTEAAIVRGENPFGTPIASSSSSSSDVDMSDGGYAEKARKRRDQKRRKEEE